MRRVRFVSLEPALLEGLVAAIVAVVSARAHLTFCGVAWKLPSAAPMSRRIKHLTAMCLPSVSASFYPLLCASCGSAL